jgi:hypothetical protein
MRATFLASLCDDDRESAAVVEKRLAATPGKATDVGRRKNRNEPVCLCNQWQWWVISSQLHE